MGSTMLVAEKAAKGAASRRRAAAAAASRHSPAPGVTPGADKPRPATDTVARGSRDHRSRKESDPDLWVRYSGESSSDSDSKKPSS